MSGIAQMVYNTQPVLTSDITPATGYINTYDATAGPLVAPLPQLSMVRVGSNFMVEKWAGDHTLNTVTCTSYAGDAFDDTTTSVVLTRPGEKIVLQVVRPGTTPYWKVISWVAPTDILSFEKTAVVNVLEYGADPTGVADSTAAFDAAIAALPPVAGSIYAPTGGGWVYAPAGRYKISSTLNFTKFQQLRGDGRYLTQLAYTGTGPCISAAGDNPPTGIATPCNFQGFSIDGASAGVGAIGLQIGNLFFSSANDIQIQFFNTTGAIGLYLKNFGSTAVMERTHFTDISLHENTNNVVFDGNSVPNTSFDYSVFEFTITAIQNQNGITLRNGAALYGCRLELRGNFASTATSNTGCVLALDPGNTAGTSSIQNGFIDLVVECDTLSPNLGHRSLVLGSASLGGIYGCVGTLVFGESTAVQFQGASITVGSFFAFSGNVQDQVLGIMVPGDSAAFHGGTQWNVFGSKTLALTAGPVFPQLGDVQEYLLPNGNVTISSLSGPYLRARKMELILHQPASGAAGTITWPANVVWARGNSTLSTTHSAVDKARFTYMPSDDKWYAELFSGTPLVALPEMSSAPSAVTAVGQLYVASDGSLHYLSPGGTDTRVAMP